MKVKLVRESLLEFHQTGDPLKSLGAGVEALLKQYSLGTFYKITNTKMIDPRDQKILDLVNEKDPFQVYLIGFFRRENSVNDNNYIKKIKSLINYEGEPINAIINYPTPLGKITANFFNYSDRVTLWAKRDIAIQLEIWDNVDLSTL